MVVVENEVSEVLAKDSKEAQEMIEDKLQIIKQRVGRLPVTKAEMYLNWMAKKTDYILKESTFKSSSLKSYSRGEVVNFDLGYNVGNEYGGPHFAVVIRESTLTNPVINIIPLTSFKVEGNIKEQALQNGWDITNLNDEQIESLIHRHSVLLGDINGLPEKKSIALVNQITTVSKIRVNSPKSPKQKVIKLTDPMLDKIDSMMWDLFLES